MAGLVEMGPRVMPIALLPLLLDRGQEADSLILSLAEVEDRRKLIIRWCCTRQHDMSSSVVCCTFVSWVITHPIYYQQKSAHDIFISYSMCVFFSNPFLYIYIFFLFGSIINLSSRRSAPSNFTHGRSKD